MQYAQGSPYARNGALESDNRSTSGAYPLRILVVIFSMPLHLSLSHRYVGAETIIGKLLQLGKPLVILAYLSVRQTHSR